MRYMMPKRGKQKAQYYIMIGASRLGFGIDKERSRCKYRYAGAYDRRRAKVHGEYEKCAELNGASNMSVEEYLDKYKAKE